MSGKNKRIALVVAICMLASMFQAAPAVAGAQTPYDEGREIIDFNDGWQFYLATRTPSVASGSGAVGFAANGLADAGGVTTAEVISPAYDDSAWRTVNVPHDFSIEGPKVSGGTSSSQGYLQGGLGWYRKTFALPEELRGKKISIDFEGVYQNSVVYVNGALIGNYPSGYTGFAYDITEELKYGDDGENVVVVKVQNLSPSGRWYTGSGIVRPVKLVVTNLTRIIRHGLVLASPALEATYTADGSAALTVEAHVYSDDSNGVVSLRTTVRDGANVVTRHVSEGLDSNPTTTVVLTDTVPVPNVRLWSLEDPFQYDVTVEVIYDRNGGDGPVVSDAVTNRYGFRYVKIDPRKGFFLNGEYAKLQGVDLHHDSGALGAASNYDAFKREMTILQGMGVNAYRTSHNPPAKEIIEVCSELGIVVMEEAYDGWGSVKSTYDFGAFFLREIPEDWRGESVARLTMPGAPRRALWSDWVIQEMVLRDINEPSVIMWSVGNEMGGVGTRPSWYNWRDYLLEGDPEPAGSYGGTSFNLFTESLRLRYNALQVDTTRYVVLGDDSFRSPPTSGDFYNMARTFDGIGVNYNTAPSVDALMERFPDTFFFESESSSQTGARGVYFEPSLPNTPANQTPGKRGTSAYDNNFASWTMPNEYGLKKDRDRKGFLGQFIWSGFDYIGEPTPYSVYPVGVSSFGTVDTAGFPKDSYYLFKSQWTSEPMAHIVPMNWNDYRPGEIVEVWVNTNAVKAELFLNGTSLGEKSFDEKETTFGLKYYETTEPTKDAGGSGYQANNTGAVNTGGYVSPNGSYGKLHLTWYVPYAPGELKAVAKDKEGREVAVDVVKTAGQAYTVDVKPDKESLAPDGRSLLYVECDIVDEAGVMLPSAGNLVKFDIEGPGAIVGVDNGKQESTELYKWGNVEKNAHAERTAYNGKVLVIVQSEKGSGPIRLTVSSENLAPVTLEVPTESGGAAKVTRPALGGVVSTERRTVHVARGTQTALPRDVKVTYESGVTLVKKVTWGAVAAEQYESAGVFTVTGAFEDGAITEPALLNVNVAAVEERKNLGLNTAAGAQDTVSAAGPLATATFTSGTANYPNYMLNGNTTNGWTNAFSASQTVVLAAVAASRPYEYVEMYWPAEQTFDQVSLYFTVDTNNKLPSALNVQYWDGFAWADAGHQEVSFAATSNGETKVTFDAVTSTRVRVGMENATPYNATTGRMRIVKFETWGADLTLRQVIYHANGGTGSLPAEAHFAGAAVTLPAADALTPPEGRRFKEWNTRSDGAGASYEAGATLTVGAADIELFAIWEEAVIALRAAVQGGALWVTLYNSPGETIEGAAIVAFYSPDGRLASAAARSFRIEPDGRLVFEETIPANHAGYDYQVFAWDEAYVPLCDAAAGSLPA